MNKYLIGIIAFIAIAWATLFFAPRIVDRFKEKPPVEQPPNWTCEKNDLGKWECWRIR
jgi:hypothetical protein